MSADKKTVIAIAGNPNSGKTTMFNALTGSHQRVGNWPGVTVEKKSGSMAIGGAQAEVVDLPGIYSLSSHSEDERVARDYLLSREANLVVNIVDASNLERNLFLTLNLLEMRVPVILVLNMMDLAAKRGMKVDPDALSAALGVPVVPISAIKRGDIGRLKDRLPALLESGKALDTVVLNRYLGIPVFLGVMYLLFWFVINVGGAFIDFFDSAFGAVFVDGFSLLLDGIGSPAWLVALLAGGIGAGIQTVATFVPIMFMMFFMLALLEDSGYMSRAAFVMDRALRAIGLPGKAFIPMIVGFGCSVPAIMATRTLENKRDRYLTVFMVPFMSCGARLPVYALFGAAFFPRNGGLIVLSLYLTGIVLAVATAFMQKSTLFRGEPSPFVMELPPYHAPRLADLLKHAWLRLKVFMFRAGKVIVITVTLLGVLNSIGTDGSFGNEDSENSVLSVVGKAITPVFSPMGIEQDNWPATVGLFTGLFAKEAVVGTLNGLYPHAAYAYLLFILIYFPCLAALGALVREMGPFFGWVSVIYLTVLAWITATLYYQIASGGQALWIVVALALLGAVIAVFSLLRAKGAVDIERLAN
jgi:ferrous iron transport protein B